MKTPIHAAAGTLAMLCILAFWSSTVVSELFLTHEAIAAVKQNILLAMWLLIPAMMATGASGFMLARQRSGRLVGQKKKRMPFIALNGILILLPSAWYLAQKAAGGEFDRLFMAVQGVELLFGGINLVLLGLNFRDGLRLSGRLRMKAPG